MIPSVLSRRCGAPPRSPRPPRPPRSLPAPPDQRVARRPRTAALPGAAVVAGLVVAASLPFAGCVDFDHLNLCEVTDTEGATVSHEQIRLRKGTVVALKGIPYGTDNGAMDEDTDVYMESADESVLGIAPLDYDGERCPGPDDAPWHYLLWGEEVGSTTLTIFVSGDPVMEIPVEVVD